MKITAPLLFVLIIAASLSAQEVRESTHDQRLALMQNSFATMGFGHPHSAFVQNGLSGSIEYDELPPSTIVYARNSKTEKETQRLVQLAKECGIYGRWRVIESRKDGRFSPAQIGQAPGDIITIRPGKEPGLSLPIG